MKERLVALKEKLGRLAPKVGFPIFYLFAFVLFCSWTFPYERLKERIVVSFNAGQRTAGSLQTLQIEDLTSSWISGVKLRGIRLSNPGTDTSKPPNELKIDDATVRVSLFGLLFGNRNISYHVNAFGGSVDGYYDDRGKDRDLEANFDSVDIGRVTPLVEMVGLPVEGSLNGTVKLETHDEKGSEKGSKPTGNVALEVSGLAVGDGKTKAKIPNFGELAVPRINVGTFAFAGEAKDGAFTVKKFGSGGKDLELQGDGRIQLREQLSESSLDLNVRAKVNDAYRGKSDVTKSILGAPGSTQPPIIDLSPDVKRAKRTDGFYAWHVRGSAAHPDFVAAGNGFGGGFPGAPGMRREKDGAP